MVVKTIKLTSLFVNTENYRFEPLSSQKEAIDKMVEDQGDKLYSHIVFITIEQPKLIRNIRV